MKSDAEIYEEMPKQFMEERNAMLGYIEGYKTCERGEAITPQLKQELYRRQGDGAWNAFCTGSQAARAARQARQQPH